MAVVVAVAVTILPLFKEVLAVAVLKAQVEMDQFQALMQLAVHHKEITTAQIKQHPLTYLIFQAVALE
jgi:hypothetical protein